MNKWLDRRIAHPGPYLTLCLTEGEYIKAMAHLRIKQYDTWVKTEYSHATTHKCTNHKSEATCVVCLRDWEERDPVEVAGLLVHEAVHIWQFYAAMIGESDPGSEQEAYAVQAIAQELMAEFARRLK